MPDIVKNSVNEENVCSTVPNWCTEHKYRFLNMKFSHNWLNGKNSVQAYTMHVTQKNRMEDCNEFQKFFFKCNKHFQLSCCTV